MAASRESDVCLLMLMLLSYMQLGVSNCTTWFLFLRLVFGLLTTAHPITFLLIARRPRQMKVCVCAFI